MFAMKVSDLTKGDEFTDDNGEHWAKCISEPSPVGLNGEQKRFAIEGHVTNAGSIDLEGDFCYITFPSNKEIIIR